MLNKYIEELLLYALNKGMIAREDIVLSRNELFALLKVREPYDGDDLDEYTRPNELLNKIIDIAVSKGLLENTISNRDILDAKIMSKLLPRQSEIKRIFDTIKKESGTDKAVGYFYELSKSSNYIRMDRISKNKYFTVQSEFGDIEITINLSKPEKDPRDIEAARNQVSSSYPKCFLCYENVGFEGRVNHPARSNHRVLPVCLNNEQWYFQYSPYVYYNEHAIVFFEEHIPMKITKKTFRRLLEFVKQFPKYFIGSNADLPLVGGSILSHDHFQGGRHTFAMDRAKKLFYFKHDDYKDVEISFVKWPLSVIRLESSNVDHLVALSNHIFDKWCVYDDELSHIKSSSIVDGVSVRHNTITPIARMTNKGLFKVDLALRNNVKNDKYPYGVFHPHEEIHHIKKENIGLIEVMGLAVLPKRLDDDMDSLVSVMTGKTSIDSFRENHHFDWIKALLAKSGVVNEQEAVEIINKGIGEAFIEGLRHCGVFKQNDAGFKGVKKFMTSIGFLEITK